METSSNPAAPSAALPCVVASSQLGGKYMSFQLAEEIYGIRILEVREIIGLLPIVRVPRVPAFVRGIVNLRGKVIPIIDLRLQFGMDACEATDQTVIIVVQTELAGRTLTMGVLVDRVLEVLAIDDAQIEPPPDLGDGLAQAGFIQGVGKAGNRVVFLLDIARVLSARDAAALEHAAQA